MCVQWSVRGGTRLCTCEYLWAGRGWCALLACPQFQGVAAVSALAGTGDGWKGAGHKPFVDRFLHSRRLLNWVPQGSIKPFSYRLNIVHVGAFLSARRRNGGRGAPSAHGVSGLSACGRVQRALEQAHQRSHISPALQGSRDDRVKRQVHHILRCAMRMEGI